MKTELFVTTPSGITVKKGDKLKCVIDLPKIIHIMAGVENYPKMGNDYTVREVVTLNNGIIAVLFDELVNPINMQIGAEPVMGLPMFSDMAGNLLDPEATARVRELVSAHKN